jgi:hypothetical protein
MTLSNAAVGRLRAALEAPAAGPRYEVGPLLGRGGMGAVYRAHDLELDRDVALKVLAVDADETVGGERLGREARLLARLEHPGIVTVHDRGRMEDGRPYYVMRLVRGVRLDEHARRVGRGDLLRIFLGVCDAVAFAHARGVIHRDLKPDNIMIGEFGEALVLDWGVAKSVGPEPEASGKMRTIPASGLETADGAAIGTPGFMAPEQAAGHSARVDARADVFGLGAILRAVLRESGQAVPAPLAAIIDRATALDPDARYTGADRLAEDLRRWLDGERVLAYRESLLERAGRFYHRNQVLILLLLAYAVVRVTILLWRGI